MSKNPLFLIAALFNWAIGAAFIAAPDLVYAYGMPGDPPANHAFLYLFALLVILFGVGYFWGYLDLEKNAPIIRLGALGKTTLFIAGVPLYATGQIGELLLVAVTADLLFAAAFVLALRKLEPATA